MICKIALWASVVRVKNRNEIILQNGWWKNYEIENKLFGLNVHHDWIFRKTVIQPFHAYLSMVFRCKPKPMFECEPEWKQNLCSRKWLITGKMGWIWCRLLQAGRGTGAAINEVCDNVNIVLDKARNDL
jgi:hypothetical protein